MYILIFLLILIKSELMVVIIVYIVYKILVWNVEYKKIIFIQNNEVDLNLKFKVLGFFSSVYFIYKSFEFYNYFI